MTFYIIKCAGPRLPFRMMLFPQYRSQGATTRPAENAWVDRWNQSKDVL